MIRGAAEKSFLQDNIYICSGAIRRFYKGMTIIPADLIWDDGFTGPGFGRGDENVAHFDHKSTMNDLQ